MRFYRGRGYGYRDVRFDAKDDANRAYNNAYSTLKDLRRLLDLEKEAAARFLEYGNAAYDAGYAWDSATKFGKVTKELIDKLKFCAVEAKKVEANAKKIMR